MASETHLSPSDVLPSTSDEIKPAKDNQAPNDSKPSTVPDKASEIHHSLSDVSPPNANKTTPPEDNLASKDDEKPTTGENNLASQDDDKSKPAKENIDSHNDDKPELTEENLVSHNDDASKLDEDNLASRNDDKSAPAEENHASQDEDKPPVAEENLSLKDDDKPTTATENLAPKDDDKPASDKENVSSKDEDRPVPDKEKVASKDEDKSALVEENLAPEDDDKPAPDQENLASKDDYKSAPAEEHLASKDDDKPTPDQENLASDDDKSAPAVEHLASKDDDKSASIEENIASKDDDKSAQAEQSLSSIDDNKSAPAEENIDSKDDNTPVPAEENLASKDNDKLVATEENVASKDDDKPGKPSDGLGAVASASNKFTEDEDNADSNDKPTLTWKDHPSLNRSKSAPPPGVREPDDVSKSKNLFQMIEEELKSMKDDPETLKKYGDYFKSECAKANDELLELKKESDELEGLSSKPSLEDLFDRRREVKENLNKLKKKVTKLKGKFPSKAKLHLLEKDAKKAELREGSHQTSRIKDKKLPGLYKNKKFEASETFGEFQSFYNSLNSDAKKLCLLCFAVFPEDAKIKKRVMIHWWMAERFISEEKGNEFLGEFTDKGFINPVFESPGFKVHSYTVHPLARPVLIFLAEKARFFEFVDGLPTEDYSSSLRACLVGNGLSDIDHLEEIHMIFNVNEPILEFRRVWFKKMVNINILFLGRWQSEEKHHIEIEDPEFLNKLALLKFLKFLSLQGVSRITELPDSIKMLGNLEILDLRACHNLEKIPTGIGYLKSLTHLDMSDCYLIDYIPKELSFLENLLVLKGFVVGDSKINKEKRACTLSDLVKLKKLKKLSIYTGVLDFPLNNDVKALEKFETLESLTISWGSASVQNKNQKDAAQDTSKSEEKRPTLPKHLKKLDLKCYPKLSSPHWLKPHKLKELKKLYIRGGKLRDLGDVYDWDGYIPTLAKNTWKVETLRLKFLEEMEITWKDLTHLFPDLMYLEKVNCPKLTLFPCNGSGVWLDKNKIRKQDEEKMKVTSPE